MTSCRALSEAVSGTSTRRQMTGCQYAFARPAFTAMKMRKVALKAGAPRAYGKADPGPDYWIKEIREREAGYVARVEQAYERMVAAWKTAPKKFEPG
jgi:hypothetical protein